MLIVDELMRALEQEGECLTALELAECLQLLVGDQNLKTALP